MRRQNKNIKLVASLVEALNANDLTWARSLIVTDLRIASEFKAPLSGIESMSQLGTLYRPMRCMTDGDDVVCFYEQLLSSGNIMRLSGCCRFKIEKGRISEPNSTF